MSINGAYPGWRPKQLPAVPGLEGACGFWLLAVRERLWHTQDRRTISVAKSSLLHSPWTLSYSSGRLTARRTSTTCAAMLGHARPARGLSMHNPPLQVFRQAWEPWRRTVPAHPNSRSVSGWSEFRCRVWQRAMAPGSSTIWLQRTGWCAGIRLVSDIGVWSCPAWCHDPTVPSACDMVYHIRRHTDVYHLWTSSHKHAHSCLESRLEEFADYAFSQWVLVISQ